ncbi:Polysaccharide export protein [Comamonadaceae bacterium]
MYRRIHPIGSAPRWLTASLLLLSSLCSVAQPAPGTDLPPPPGPEVLGKMPAKVEVIDLKAANLTPQRMKLERDDVIKLTVLGYPELTHVGKVQRDGRLALPVVGDVVAEGKTLNELRDDVRQRLLVSSAEENSGLAVDDVIRMVVWRHPDLTATVPVAADGTVSLPLANDVNVQGKSLAEVRAEVKARLSTYLRDPQVSILIEKQVRRGLIVDPQVSILPERMRERKVVVVGEVLVQGPQPIGEQSRVMDVLAGARINSQSAQLNDVVLIRNADGKVPQYTTLRMEDFLSGKATDQNIFLTPDDVIVVPKTRIASIGDFIERFFVRTKPVFDWWNAAYQAKYAEQYNRSIVNLYDRTLGQ